MVYTDHDIYRNYTICRDNAASRGHKPVFSLGVTRMDRIRNEYIRGTAHVRCFGDKVREARLRERDTERYRGGIVNISVEGC
ncbi:hypothetical protein LDENG_00006140 [Lucifuga dentata]|nr:hypothetical protein LDENG_00006140 [Lucifuga dentata]